MPIRNGPKSNNGRSAIARRVINTNSTNGNMPHVIVQTQLGPVRTSYFGGPIKGGGPPSGTGQIRSFSLRSNLWPINLNTNNYLFKIKQQP